MSRRLPHLLCLAFALAGAVPLAAAPAMAAPKIVAPAGAPLMLEAGKGELVHLDHPASSVFVADPDVADVQVKSPTLVYVFGKSGGETTLFAVGENDQVVLNMNVRVRLDTARVQEAIHKLVPRSAISVSSVDDSLVLEGTVYSAADGDDVKRVAERFLSDPKQLVNKMRVDAPNQVNLRVRVAEVSRQVVKELGFNWETLSGSGNFLFGLATGHPVVPAVPTAAAFPDAFFTRSAVPGATTADTVNNLSAGFNKGSNNIDVLI